MELLLANGAAILRCSSSAKLALLAANEEAHDTGNVVLVPPRKVWLPSLTMSLNRQPRLFPANEDMQEKAGHEDEVQVVLADDLAGDVDVPTSRVFDLWLHGTSKGSHYAVCAAAGSGS